MDKLTYTILSNLEKSSLDKEQIAIIESIKDRISISNKKQTK